MSYDAELYAQLHRGTPGDLAFYLDALRSAEQVLELGCGYGRILTELARAGHPVTGLDIDKGMLELAQAACASLTPQQASLVSICRGDMRNFRIDQRFDRIIIPFNGLYCMLSEAAVIDCLSRASEHLHAKGLLLFDAYAIDDFHDHADPQLINSLDEDDEPFESIHWQGRRYDVFESCLWNKAAQRLDVRYRHVPLDDAEVQHTSLAHRYILTWQVPELCAKAGLEVLHLYEDFQRTALTPDAEHMVCIAQKI